MGVFGNIKGLLGWTRGGSGFTPIVTDPLADGLAWYYKFDGNSTRTIGTNNGVDTNTTYPAGLINQASAFTGNGYIQMADSQDFSLLGFDFTICIWIKPAVIDGTPQWFFGQWGPGANDSTLSYVAGIISDKIRFLIRDTVPVVFQLDGTSTIVANQWTQIVARRTGSSVELRVNNVVEATATIAATISDSAQNMGVGRAGEFDGFKFNGECDIFLGYKRSLSEDELASLYNGGAGYQPIIPTRIQFLAYASQSNMYPLYNPVDLPAAMAGVVDNAVSATYSAGGPPKEAYIEPYDEIVNGSPLITGSWGTMLPLIYRITHFYNTLAGVCNISRPFTCLANPPVYIATATWLPAAMDFFQTQEDSYVIPFKNRTNPNDQVVNCMNIGQNDGEDFTAAVNFQVNGQAVIDEINSLYPGAIHLIFLMSADDPATYKTLIRAAQLALVAANPNAYLVDGDAWPNTEGNHYGPVKAIQVGSLAADVCATALSL